MLRRAAASLLLTTLLTQTGVALAACHRSAAGHGVSHARDAGAPAHGHAGHAATSDSRDGSALRPHAPADPPLDHVCNRHHRGACPHARGAVLGPCESDPVAGLQAAAEAGLPQPVAAGGVIPQPAPLPPLSAPLAEDAVPPLPEPPPPRA